MLRPQSILEQKSTLFSIVIIGVVAILAIPVIIPNILHGFHFAHISLHIGGVALATFITILAILAYSKLKTKRLLLSAIAFANFITAEILMLIDVTWSNFFYIENLSFSEIGHILTFSTLGLLALGVFRND